MPSTYKYSYPNWKSYAMIPPRPRVGLYNGLLLRHGYIYGYKKTSATADNGVNPYTGASTDSGTGNVHPTPTYRQIDWATAMVFQFNPAALPISVQMMPQDTPESQISGGNLPSVGVGLASTRLELFFDRTNEVARATARNPKRAGESKWRELGVQCDLFDLLLVISGGDSSVLKGWKPQPGDDDASDSRPVLPESLNYITGQMLDSAITGSNIMLGHPFAVVFNQNLAVNVMQMNSFAFTYLRFNADLVPTLLKVEMDLQITNMGTKAYVQGMGGPAGSTTSTTDPMGPPGTRPSSTTTSGITYY